MKDGYNKNIQSNQLNGFTEKFDKISLWYIFFSSKIKGMKQLKS